MNHKYVFKYIIIGDMNVGKSSIMQRFVEQNFRKDMTHTIGVDFGTTTIDLNGDKVKLQIWDTAGQERFRSVTKGYYRGAAVALLVFDVTRRSSYTHLNSWLRDARDNTNPQTVIILVGNKTDLEEERAVSYEEAEQFANENNLLFIECSALSGENVTDIFSSTAYKIHGKIACGDINPADPDSGVQLHRAAIIHPSTNLIQNTTGNNQTPSGNGSSSCSC